MKPNKHQMFKVLVLLTSQDSEHCVAPNIPASTNKQSGKLLYSGTHITPFFDRFQSLLIFFRPRSPLLQSAKRIPEWRTAQHLRGQFSPPECLLSTEFKPRYTAEGATFSVRCSLTAWAEVERQGLGQGRFQHGGRHNLGTAWSQEQPRIYFPDNQRVKHTLTKHACSFWKTGKVLTIPHYGMMQDNAICLAM